LTVGAAATLVKKRKAVVLSNTASLRRRRKAKLLEVQQSFKVPAQFVSDFVTRLQVSLVQTQDTRCVDVASRPLMLKLNAQDPLLLYMLGDGHVEHWIRVFDAVSRDMWGWYATIPDSVAYAWWVCCGTVAVRFILVDGSPARDFLQDLQALKPAQYTSNIFRKLLAKAMAQKQELGKEDCAYRPFGRCRTACEIAAMKSKLFKVLVKALEEKPPILYDPTYWMKMTGLSVQVTAETQFSIMQLAMDWYCSPIAEQRQMLDPLLPLYYMRGSGCPDGGANCPYAVKGEAKVRRVADVTMRHCTVRRATRTLGFKLQPFFTVEPGLCGARKWEVTEHIVNDALAVVT
jgi:hypothetical protein